MSPFDLPLPWLWHKPDYLNGIEVVLGSMYNATPDSRAWLLLMGTMFCDMARGSYKTLDDALIVYRAMLTSDELLAFNAKLRYIQRNFL